MSVELSKTKAPASVTAQGTSNVRWDATLTNGKGQTHHTFTWANTREAACERMDDVMAQSPDLWRGWTYTLADAPTTFAKTGA